MSKFRLGIRRALVPTLSAALVLLLLFGINAALISAEEASTQALEQEKSRSFDKHLIEHLTVITGEAISVTDSLALYIKSTGANFKAPTDRLFLDGLLKSMPDWRNISVAPNNCITDVAPVAGNEGAIGYCLKNSPDEWAEIQDVILQKQGRLLGPFRLAQGGLGFILHRPVFLSNGDYWGLVSVVIEKESFLRPLVKAASEDGMDFAIRFGDLNNRRVHSISNGLPAGDKYGETLKDTIGGNTFSVSSSSVVPDMHRVTDITKRMALIAFFVTSLCFVLVSLIQRQLEIRRKLIEVSKLAPSVLFQISSNKDSSLTMDFISSGSAQLLGVDSELIMGDSMQLTKIFKMSDLEIAAARLRAAKSPGEVWRQRLELLEPVGEIRIIQAEATFERVTKKSFHWNGVFTDVTETVAFEKANAVTATAFGALDEGVAVLDADFNILTINQAITKVTGYLVEDVVGKNFMDFGGDLNSPDLFNDILTGLQEHDIWRGQILNRYANGSVARDILTFSPVKLPNGEITQIVLIMNATHLSLFDTVSQLPNRTLFEEGLSEATKKAAQDGGKLVLLHIGVTGIGAVNDSFGHTVGDLVLREIGARLSPFTPTGKCIGRIGDAEFGLYRALEADHDPSAIGVLTQSIRKALTEPFIFDDVKVLVSTSIGVSLYPDDSSSVSELRTHADQAFKVSLHDSAIKVSYFSKNLEDSAKAKSYLTSYLQEALEKRTIEFYYQPIVRILDRKVTKAEVLSRWFDEHLGQVSPARFIPLAENSNLIGQLGAQVLEDVLETIREVQKMGREVQISLNVSPVEFMSENFSEDKAQSFAKFSEVEKASIVFELTEGIFLNKKELIEERITEFHDQGIKFAIDDFGTGYSSLAYLQQLDVDFIKIDKAFIDKIETAEGLALCKAIVDLSHALGLQLIAEGVETETQLHLLEQIGCEYAQGYFFSKPVPKGDFLRLLG
jgi:diguanylate cyclase (GGDEF)-like protein/PAS domain S-box-containing protein